MQLSFDKEELAFRDQVQAFLSQGVADELRQKVEKHEPLSKHDRNRWHKALFEQGWAATNWPAEYGGTGWTPVQKHIFYEEMFGAGLPLVSPFGLSMVAPLLMAFGTQAQQQRFLPGILNGDVWWCQGFSEPGAGSDLASLTTRAVRDGDHYVVDGAKTWTTEAHLADWIFCLVRTRPEAAKQQGISFLLIDMTTPGVRVRPIITFDGAHEVNEVFLDNVRVPVENRLGEENQGWTYAKSLLLHERTGIAAVGWSKQLLRRLNAFINRLEWSDENELSAFKRKLAAVEIELKALEYTDLRTLAGIKSGGAPGPESSILKIKGTEVQQALTELFWEATGYLGIPLGAESQAENSDPEPRNAIRREAAARTHEYMNFRKVTIFGGSSEIQKNIIAKAVLGL